MKKILLMLLTIAAAFHFTGCKKVIDQIHHNPGQDFQFCDIKKFKVWFGDTYNEFTVHYNNKGQPIDVLGKYPDTPALKFHYDQHFRYDKQGRLTDWITNSTGELGVFLWDTYHYLSPTRVLDSTWVGPVGTYITDQHPHYSSTTYTLVVPRLLDYDQYGRVIKISDPDPNNNNVQDITYDSNGNSNLYASYDNGVNLMRTNKIWMFTNNNYNTNNFVKGSYFTNTYTYNSYMLPTSITVAQTTQGAEQFWVASFVFTRMEIEYDCKESPKYY